MGAGNNFNDEGVMEKRFKISVPFLLLAVYAAMLTGFFAGAWFTVHDQTKAIQIALN